ncbi:MAG: ribonuclease PH [Planctomycetota bacterium]|nr:MAG: ribonuclease PH [Planctomycetota bacterium]
MTETCRVDGRTADELRPVRIQRGFTDATPGSVCIRGGRTVVLCTAAVEESVPPWKLAETSADEEPTGWVTAEYAMLPGSTQPRKRRERTKVEGRTSEIQRLIGRSLRAVVDFAALGPRTIIVDCDVLQADGGTRTLSITGGFVALVDALRSIDPELPRRALRDSVAAVSVGIVGGQPMLDLQYAEDSEADVDCNVVMTGKGGFVEIQGTAEKQVFSRTELDAMLRLAEKGIRELTRLQRDALGEHWPFNQAPRGE